MRGLVWTWLPLTAIYAAFFLWYTSLGGPLSDAEIEQYMARFAAREPAPSPTQLANLRRFMEQDTGDDFVMVNLIEMNDTPRQIPGVSLGESSADVLAKYMAYMFPALFARASHPVMGGSAANAAMDLMNAPGMARWTSAGLMRYRSRRDLLEIALNPEFAGAHRFKVAAMRKTIAVPIDPWFQLGDSRLVLFLALALIGTSISWWQAARR